MFLVLGFIVSLIPSLLLFRWFLKLKDDGWYKDSCKKAMIKGLLLIVPVFLASTLLVIAERLIFPEPGSLARIAFHEFVAIAFAEELVKYLAGLKVIDSAGPRVSRLDLIVIMGIVGTGFGLAEDIPYAIGSSVPVMIIRGIGISHGVYGMLTGLLLGRIMEKGGRFGLPALAVSWLIHGLYDFGLDETVNALWDGIAFIPVSIAVGEVILLLVFIRFIGKARKDVRYTAPLFPLSVEPDAD